MIKLMMLILCLDLVTSELKYKRSCKPDNSYTLLVEPSNCINYLNSVQLDEIITKNNDILREKLNHLEDLDQRLSKQVSLMEKKLNVMSTLLADKSIELSDLQKKVTMSQSETEARQKKLEYNLTPLQVKTDENTMTIKSLGGTLDNAISTLRTQMKGARVAFSASAGNAGNGINPGVKSWSEASNILILNYVFTNVGNAYNSSTGIFTAPVNGIYHFTYMTFAFNSTTSGAILVKNGVMQISTWETMGPDPSDVTSNAVILNLIRGDTVNIILWRNGSIYNSVFSGFLVFPMD